MKIVRRHRPAIPILVLAFLGQGPGETAEIRIATVEAFAKASRQAQPGDVLVLREGLWENAQLTMAASGTKEKPITSQVSSRMSVGGSRFRMRSAV